MRWSALVLAFSLLVGCESATVRSVKTSTAQSYAPSDPASLALSCDPAEHRLMRVADGRVEPVLFCN